MSSSYCFVVLNVILGICGIQHWCGNKSYLSGKRKMGNVLQQREPCPHTNIVEHSVGQASSRKLQASMHGKQSDSARLKRKSCGLTLCKTKKVNTNHAKNNSPSYFMPRLVRGEPVKGNALLGTQQYAPRPPNRTS